MIDPSLVVAKKSFPNTLIQINKLRRHDRTINIYMPHTFKTLLLEEPENILDEENPVFRFYLQNTTPIEFQGLSHFKSEYSNLLIDYKVSSEFKEKYSWFYTFFSSLPSEPAMESRISVSALMFFIR